MTKWDSSARPDPDAESAYRDDGTLVTPIEAVISEQSSSKLHAAAELSEEIAEERSKRASEPIHMEGLRPLPPGMPRLPNGVIPGGDSATTLVPSMRKTIPAPFKRERISVDHHGKTWAYMQAAEVLPGDIVVDFGMVAARSEVTCYEVVAGVKAAVGVEIHLWNILDERKVADPPDQLRVFRRHDE